MAQLLIRVIDKRSGDPARDRRLLQRGDVVVVMPDGHQWGRSEVSSPEWRILSVPGVTPEDLASLVAEQPADGPDVAEVPRLRAFGLQIDSGPLAALDAAGEPLTLNLSVDEMLALRVRRA